MKPKPLAIAGASLAVALSLFVLLPLPYSHRTTFVIEPADRIPIRAATEGFIGSVAVNEGDAVRRGALLAVMRDVDLEQKRDSLRAEMALLDRQIMQQQAQGATAESLKARRHRDQIMGALAETQARLEQLRIISPADGVVVTPKVSEKVGEMLKRGDEFCQIAGIGAARVRVVIDDWDLDDVRVGASASLRLNAVPELDVSGHVVTLAPASELHQRLSPVAAYEKANEQTMFAVKNSPVKSVAAKSEKDQVGAAAAAATSPFEAPLSRFVAVIAIEEATAAMKPGMSGQIKIYGNKRPLASSVWRGMRNWFRSKIWW